MTKKIKSRNSPELIWRADLIPESARQKSTRLQIAGVGFFFGFFTSLFLRCCPFAMIALLLWLRS